METIRIKIHRNEQMEEHLLLQAAQLIRSGGLVAFPTETVYGLGANALDEEAAGKIYQAKGRPSDNPLIAHIADFEGLNPLVLYIPEMAEKLAAAFWPGPLTMVFAKSGQVPYGTTGGLETVAVRMPADPIARQLIALSGVPVAAPSANTSGRPSPTLAEHVWTDLHGKIDLLIDGGPVGIGLESTIVDVSGDVPMLLRPGAVTLPMLEAVVGRVVVDPAITGPADADVKPKAPGMKYRHYAPQAQLTLVEGAEAAVAAEINHLVQQAEEDGSRAGIICTEETAKWYAQGELRCIGSRRAPETIARNLFAVLREFDELRVEYIYSECFSDEQLGQAIMNRLKKAAGYRICKV